ncbi:phage tail assembly chaperone [Citromicrobium bathyomarinum]|uniref:phage tail assembly chaperone n=1 Tax=Citromicrobium bathyomarinum TaxID=72174 RepID=UPI00315A87A1
MSDFRSGVPPLAALAAQALGWPPDAFWRATPAELATALGPIAPQLEGMTRSDLKTLMERDADA